MVTPGQAAVVTDAGVITTPNGTITMVIDDELAVLRVYSEPEPDEEDWKIAKAYIREVAAGTLGCPHSDGPVDVFVVSISKPPGVSPVPAR